MAEPESNFLQENCSGAEHDRNHRSEPVDPGDSTSPRRSAPAIESELSSLTGQHLFALDALLDAPTAIDSSSAPTPAPPSDFDIARILQTLGLLGYLRQDQVASEDLEPTLEAPSQDATLLVPSRSVADLVSENGVEFGRFRLAREVGRGGFGVVYLAWDPQLNREIALKIPRPEMVMNRELCCRFAQEGRAVALLEHPNILPVLEAGEVHGIPYLTSPYNVGPSLFDWLRSRAEAVPPRQAALLLAQLAEGMHHAHLRGIIHRDLKPGNVLLTRRSSDGHFEGPSENDLERFTPRITDFGLAKNLFLEDNQTRTGVRMGTPRYSAPEQVDGLSRKVGPETDVFALGVILYELLTLTTPYAEASGWQLQQAILQEDAPSPRQISSNIPLDLEAICLKCLKKHPQDRYPSADELARDLRRFLRGETVHARLPSILERGRKWVSRNPVWASLYGTILVSIAALSLLGLWHVSSVHQINQQLQSSIENANEQAERARLTSYAAQIRLAHEFMAEGQVGWMGDILKRVRPLPGQKDLREFSWHYLWNLARNDLHSRAHQSTIDGAAFNSTGDRVVTVSTDRTIRLWDPATGTALRTYSGFRYEPISVAYFPDDQKIVAATRSDLLLANRWSPGELHVWEINGRLRYSRQDPAKITSRVAVTPDGKTVAYGRMNEDKLGCVCLWNPDSAQVTYLLPDRSLASAVAYAPDGSLAVATHDDAGKPGKITVFQPGLTRIQCEWTAHENWIRTLAFSPEGTELLSGGNDGSARAWDVTTGKQTALVGDGHFCVHEVAYSRDGKALAYLAEAQERISEIYVLDRKTSQRIGQPYRVENSLFGSAISPDASLVVTGGADHVSRFWVPRQLPPAVDLPAHELETWRAAFTPDGQTLLSGSDDHLIKVWDIPSLKLRRTFAGHDALVSCLVISPDGKVAATGSFDNHVKLWDLNKEEEIATLREHRRPMRALAFSPGGDLLASSGKDARICIWDTPTHQLIRTLPEQPGEIRGLVFSPDGKYLASVSFDRSIKLWDTATWEVAHEWIDSHQLWSVQFSPDGKLLATCGDGGTPTLWDLETFQARTVFGGHEARCLSLAFSPDGQTLASGGIDRTVRLWHVATGLELICFRNLPAQVNSVTFSRDGRTLAAALHDGKVRLWGTYAWQSQGLQPQ